MTTAYPGAIDSLPRPTLTDQMDDTGLEGDVVIDNISDAIEAIQTELGTDPAGVQSTVNLRIGTIETDVSNMDTEVNYLIAGSAVRSNITASGATETLRSDLGVQVVAMDQNCTFTFPSASQTAHSFVLHLSGAFTPTFPASVDWSDATPPTYTSPSVYVFTTFDSGTTWLGAQVGKAFG